MTDWRDVFVRGGVQIGEVYPLLDKASRRQIGKGGTGNRWGGHGRVRAFEHRVA